MAEATPTVGAMVETKGDGLSPAASDIIRRHVIYAAVGGLVPIPLAEYLLCGVIQMRMVAQLCTHYGLRFQRQAVKATIGTMVGSLVPVRTTGLVSASLIRVVPVLGPVISVANQPALVAALTWAVGRVFAWHFAQGGTIMTFNAATKKEQIKREFQEGKRRAAEFVKGGRAKAPAPAPAKATEAPAPAKAAKVKGPARKTGAPTAKAPATAKVSATTEA